MWTELLLGLAWLAIILIPAFIASRQPVVSHNGYLDNYMDPGAENVKAKDASLKNP